MADINQKINIKEIVDVSDALKGIKQIQDSLSHLKVGAEAKASFDRLFSNIQQQAEKANAALATGFKNKGDVTKYNNAMGQIISSYDEILRKIEVLKAKGHVSLDVDDKALKDALDRIKTLKAEWKKAQNELDSAQRRTLGNMSKAADNHKGGAAAWSDAVKAFKDGDIEGAEKALKKLNIEVQKAENRASKNNTVLSEDWEKYKTDVQKMTDALNEYKDAEDKELDARKSLNTEQAKADAIYAKGAQELTTIAAATQTSAQGARDFAKATTESAKSTQQLNSELEQFKNKAAYFFGLSNAINLFKRAVRSAYDTVKDLDAVMTETAVVTDFDVGDMWEQLPEYTQRANELGVSIHSAYEAATIFYQQGLKTNEVMAVSNETLKMARIAGLDAATASDRMTNALRGFNMEMDKMSAQRVNDVYSKLAAITASDTDEISTAMTKVASLAHNANMEFETTAAFLAQIIESTRESAETAGTALKTVVARFSEVKELYSKGELLGQDEEGEEIDVNRVSTALRSAGINLNEYLTGAKGLDDIFMELAEKWDSLDIVQQRYIATMAAGSRQQSRFIALMSDYKRTVELVDAANNANGASNEQYGKTLESLETKLARLKNAWNEFVLGLANSDAIKGAVDLLTNLITAINKLISAISGKNSGVKMITTFFTAFSAFKIGQAAIGKSGILTAFFGKLTGNADVVTKGSAGEIAKLFYANLATGMAKFQKNGSFKGVFENIKTSVGDSLNGVKDYFLPNTEDIKEKLFNSLDPKLSNEEFDKLWEQLDQGNLTVGQFNEVLKQNGQNFRISETNAEEFGLAVGDDTEEIGRLSSTMKITSAAALALGGIMVGIGNSLEQQEGPMRDFGTLLKSLGSGLMVFGTIMSVYIPLRAQMMAQGVTGAIMSIPIVGFIAAVIAALTALGMAIYSFAKNNSLEVRLEKASTDAKNAAQAADDAREAYEKLGEAWDNLEDKYDAIENATKGTQEWRDAIREVNDAVLALANTYDNVNISRDSNGILHITNQDEIDSQERTKASNAAAAARLSKIRTLDLEQEDNYKDLTNAWNEDKAYKKLLDDFQKSGRVAELADMTDDEINKLVAESYREQGYDDANSRRAVGAVRDYAIDYRNNQDARRNENLAIGSTILGEAGIDASLQKYANSILTDEYINGLMEDTREEVIASYEQGVGDKDIKEAYAEARGYTDYNSYRDANPDEEEPSIDQMEDYVVGAEALKIATERLDIFTKNVAQLSESDAAKALFAEQDGGALTQAQLNELRNADVDELFKKLGGEEVFGSLDNFVQQFNNTLQNAADSFDTSRFSGVFVQQLDASLTDSLSSDTFKTFTNNLWSVYAASGEEGMKQVQDTIKSITDEMDNPEDKNKFIKAINSVDWASADSVRTLSDLAEEYGVSEAAIKNLENQIIDLNNAINQIDLEKLTSSLSLAKKIGSGEQGRSFTEEQYNEAIANGANKKDFILNIETGNYDYIGEDILDVRNAIIEQTNEIIAQLDKQYASDLAIGEALSKSGNIDTESVEDLRGFIGNYITAAGENSAYDWDFFYSAGYDELKKAYDKLIQDYGQRYDVQAQLDEATLKSYQTNSGTTNANLALSGDEQAADVLKQQLINSGLSEEEYKRLISGINNYDQTTGQYAGTISSAGSVVDTFDQAEQYGIEAEDLNEYVEALRQVDDLQQANTATLYELALANARYQEGFKNVIDSYDEWIQLRQEDGSIRAEDGNDIQQKAYTQLKKDLKEMLNLSEDVSDEFMQMPETAELLERAVNGDIEAVAELRANLAKIKISGQFNPVDQDAIYNAIDAFTQESYTLEFGASWNDSALAQGLYDALVAAGATVDQINEAFSNIGWTPPVETEVVQIKDVVQTNGTGYQQIVHPDGSIEEIPIESLYTENQEGYITIPVVGENAHFVPPEMPSYTPSSSSGGGGGGGGSEKKPSYWENPYDELYNLQEKINEALRTREALERRYQKLLKEEKATLADIRKAYYSQINNLRAEADLQKQFAAGRLRQIQNIGEQMYTDSEGDRSSFSSWGVTKYASYDANTGLIQIDWNGLEEIANDSDREEEGKAAEAYISKLEELVSSYEEVRDKLWDIEDEIESLREAAIESYLSFEDRVLEALVNSYQQQIDSYQAMSDSLEKANNEVLTSLREQIELSRQIRDNTDKEKQIADMENRLAYLQRDTSNSNALEIQKLQKDLEDARENYTDTLVDQAIEKMQNEADLAAEQRARQIETMQEQLEIMKETGALWQQVYDLMDEAAAGNGALSPKTTLVELLKDTEAFESLSNIGQAKWWSEVAEEFHAAWVGRDEAEDKYKVDANNDGVIANSGTSAAISSVSATATSVSPASSASSSNSGPSDADEAGVAMNICGPNNGWGDGETRRNRLEEKGFDYSTVQSIVNDIVNSGWDDSYYRRKYGISDLSDYSYYAFKSGGLADFTGPAWLDGTKAKPELILNAQDSANFIALKDILASLLNVQGGGLNGTKNGDNYFDIDISANIGSDYDVDRLAERLKQNIYNDGQYRNVNTINFLR